MIFLRLLLLVFLTTQILNADYIRSIRLGSYPSEESATKALDKVNEFVNAHENIGLLMEERDFEFKSRASGKYYITLVEPFTDREILQEVLDTLRLNYPDIFVTKLKELPVRVHAKEEILDVTDLEEERQSKYTQETETEEYDDAQIDETISEELEPETTGDSINEIEANEDMTIAKGTIVEDKVEEESSLIYFKVLSFLLFMGIIVLVRYILAYKKDNDTYINKEIIYHEKIDKINTDVVSKDKLLSHVSHELRTPMTAIMGLTHLVLESELTKLQKDYILKIESSSEHLLNLINDILDVSKIQAGELKLEKVEFNINDILEYVFNVNAINAKRNKNTFYMDSALDIPSKVVGDSLRLGQVLINLIGNAVKFTQNGEVSLHVKKLSNFGDSITLEFSVSDTGIGMTTEQVNNIFNSFYQADDSISREFGGTGLGLSISKELVEMMDGEIKVSSQKDVGTTFSFTAVLKLKDPDNQRHYRLPSSSMLNKKILIVESSNKNVISLIKALGYFNYKTNTIPSFEESVMEDDVEFDIIIINQYNLTKVAMEKIERMQRKLKTKLVVLNEIYCGLNTDLLSDFQVDAFLQVPSSQQSVLNMIVDLYVAKNLDKRSRKATVKDKLKEFAGKKILVAEDNDVNQKVISGLMAKTGVEMTYVNDGQEALDLIRKDIHFDLVLMDINMPNLNGYDATREIRKSNKYNTLPILALTGDVTDEAISKSVESGMQGHISKPIIIDIFYKKIYDMLSAQKIDFAHEESVATLKSAIEDGYEELSVSVGLSRCHGDKEFYKSILQDFQGMYINSAKSLKNLCEESKFKEARRMAMDIKDIALNIGAYNLCESAASMEYEFEKGSRSKWRELITYYDGVLKILLEEVDKYLK